MKMVWADSPHLEQIYLEIAINEGLGALVVQERKADEPRVIFCSLFDDPAKVFYEGLDKRSVGLTLKELKQLISEIESTLEIRPFE